MTTSKVSPSLPAENPETPATSFIGCASRGYFKPEFIDLTVPAELEAFLAEARKAEECGQ